MYDDLIEYATPSEKRYLEAISKHGNQKKAADALNVNPSSISRSIKRLRMRAARSDYSQHTNEAPPGYKVRGVSTLTNKDGEVLLQWRKTSEDRDRLAEVLAEIVEGLKEEVPRAAPTKYVEEPNDALCAVYPVGDHHFGMYAWGEETGEDYDLGIAEQVLLNATSHLTRSMPTARTALVPILGDLFHYDGLEPVTPRARNQLDSDGRFRKMVRYVARSTRTITEQVLQRHERVRLIFQPGNHDQSMTPALSELWSLVYENDPRVEVDTSASPFHYYRFGRSLIGVCHGHEVKDLTALPLIMAEDRPEDWGKTKYRYWYTGHIHKQKTFDVQGTLVESFRVLAAPDAYAVSSGYRQRRSMSAIVLHEEFGEQQRITVNPEMFKED